MNVVLEKLNFHVTMTKKLMSNLFNKVSLRADTDPTYWSIIWVLLGVTETAVLTQSL